MGSRVILLVVLLASVAWGADAPKIPDAAKCGPIDCDVLKNDASARSKREAVNAAKGKFIDVGRIDEYRKRFWATYPDKDGHDEAREDFAQALYKKDCAYLQMNILKRVYTAGADPGAKQGIDIIAKRLEHVSGGIDVGIRKPAQAEYDAWTAQVWRDIGGAHTYEDIILRDIQAGVGTISPTFAKAANFSGKQYQQYLMARDWAEFDAAKVVPAEFNNPQHYGELIYIRFGSWPYEDALRVYQDMCQALGRPIVESAAKQVLEAPKNENGEIVCTIPPPLKVGPGGSQVKDYDAPMPADIIRICPYELTALEMISSKDDDRRYAIYQITDQFSVNRKHLDPKATPWSFADAWYKALEKAFGPQQVIEAARQIRVATKRYATLGIMNPQAIGATRPEPGNALQDILARKNPKGYVRFLLAINQNSNSPANVDIDAAYQKLISTSNEKSLLDTALRFASGKPNLFWPGELDSIKRSIGSMPEPQRPTVATAMIDNPDYVGWKNFKSGAQIKYTTRTWSADPRVGPAGKLMPGHSELSAMYTLKSIDGQSAQLWFTEQAFDTGSGYPHPPRDLEIAYPAKLPAPDANQLQRTEAARRFKLGEVIPGSEQSGEEVLVIQGQRIKTHWTSVTGKQRSRFTVTTKTWTSDEVPTGLVRKTEDTYWPGDVRSRPSRSITETYIESFKGFTPGEAAPAGTTNSVLDIPEHPPFVTLPPAGRGTDPSVPPPEVKVVRVPPGGGRTAPAQPISGADQRARIQRLMPLLRRAATARRSLLSIERQNARSGTTFPDEVQSARDKIMAQIQSAQRGMVSGSEEDFDSEVKALEKSTTTIEDYLQKQEK